MTVDLPQLVHDTLVETYVKLRGHAPEGAFYPNADVADQLRAAFRGQPTEKLVRWLRDAMFAHMARTEITRTPFYVNSHLLAESSISYMEKHRNYLRSFYGAGYEPRVFEQSVYGAIMATETDYLDLFGNCYLRTRELPEWELLTPSVWWMIWADTFRRVRTAEFPPQWLAQRIMHGGMRQTAEQLLSRERTRLADKHRMEVAERAACDCMREAAVTWAGNHHAARVLYQEGRTVMHPESPITEELVEAKVPLDQRDLALFEAVRTHSPQATKPPPAPDAVGYRGAYENRSHIAQLARDFYKEDDA